jgi:hypothetical protein
MIRRYIDYHTAARREAFPVLRVADASQVGRTVLTPVIELPFRLDMDGVGNEGFIDFAVTNAADRWQEATVIDWKSGRSEPSEHIQMAEYAWALRKLHAADWQRGADYTIWGSYWMARKGEYSPPVDLLRAYPWEELVYRFAAAARGYAAGVFAPHVTNLCVSCTVRPYCPAGSR